MVGSTWKAIALHRREIARLKRSLVKQEKSMARLKKQLSQQRARASDEDESLEGVRFFGPLGSGPASAARIVGR